MIFLDLILPNLGLIFSSPNINLVENSKNISEQFQRLSLLLNQNTCDMTAFYKTRLRKKEKEELLNVFQNKIKELAYENDRLTEDREFEKHKEMIQEGYYTKYVLELLQENNLYNYSELDELCKEYSDILENHSIQTLQVYYCKKKGIKLITDLVDSYLKIAVKDEWKNEESIYITFKQGFAKNAIQAIERVEAIAQKPRKKLGDFIKLFDELIEKMCSKDVKKKVLLIHSADQIGEKVQNKFNEINKIAFKSMFQTNEMQHAFDWYKQLVTDVPWENWKNKKFGEKEGKKI